MVGIFRTQTLLKRTLIEKGSNGNKIVSLMHEQIKEKQICILICIFQMFFFFFLSLKKLKRYFFYNFRWKYNQIYRHNSVRYLIIRLAINKNKSADVINKYVKIGIVENNKNFLQNIINKILVFHWIRKNQFFFF